MSDLMVDLRRAAELYIRSSYAQHGDLELAEAEAEVWLEIFRQARKAPSRRCSICREPATWRVNLLLPNARTNPSSRAYRRYDSIVYVADKQVWRCADHYREDEVNKDGTVAFEFCSAREEAR